MPTGQQSVLLYGLIDPGGGSARANIIVGTTKPGPLTTGPLRPEETGYAPRTNVSDTTITTNGTVFENKNVVGALTINAANVTCRNFTAGRITMTHANCSNVLLEDFAVRPPSPHYSYAGGLVGHDFTARRGVISGHLDGAVIHNTSAGVTEYPSNVVMEHVWVNKLAYWTAASAGVVHTSDTWSHNDGIQHQGGWGSIIRGCLIDASFEKQYGHWFTSSFPVVEPYAPIALNSLGDGGPWHELPDRGYGTEFNGRYNADATSPAPKASSLTAILVGNNVGTSRELVVTDNWIYGGDFGVNLGGFNRGTETNIMGWFLRNRFDHSQGNQNTTSPPAGGSNTSHTMSGAGSGWTGFLFSGAGTADRNYYEDSGIEIEFRGD